MAGIFGIVDNGDSIDLPKAGSIFLEEAQHGFVHPSDLELDASTGILAGYAMPHLYSGASPLVLSTDRYLVLVKGEVFLANGEVLRSSNCLDGFLQPYFEAGDALLRSLDGAFIIVLINKLRKELTIINDPFGNFAIHYAATTHGIVFSSQMRALARVTGDRLSKENLQESMALGFNTSGKTPYRSIFRLPAESVLRSKEGSIRVTSYARPIQDESVQRKQIPSSLRELGSLLDRSIERRTRCKGTLAALSGGFDSRLIWAAILARGNDQDVRAYTHGTSQSRDVTIAQKIAKQTGVDHILRVIDDSFIDGLPIQWRSTVERSEGGLAISDSFISEIWSRHDPGTPVVLDGVGGAVYCRQYLKVSSFRMTSNMELAPQLLPHVLTPQMKSGVLRNNVSTEMQELALASLVKQLSELPQRRSHHDVIDDYTIGALCAFKLSLSGNAQLDYVGQHHPLLANGILELVKRLPLSFRIRHGIHRGLIDQFAPALRKFSVDNAGNWAPYRMFAAMRYPAMVYEKALRTLGPRYSKRLSRNFPTVTLTGLVGPHLQQLIDLALDIPMILSEYYDMERLQSEIVEARHGNVTALRVIHDTASMNVFVKHLAETG